MNLIRSLLEALLSALLPAMGRHRAGGRHAARGPVGPPADEPVARPVRVTGPVARGEDIGVVRPYLVAFEQEQRAAQSQRKTARRRTLWLAPHGVDLLPRHMTVAA